MSIGDSGTVHVVFCVDPDALVGLHVTARTALRSLGSGATLAVHLMHHRVSDEQVDLLRRTLDMVGKPYCLSGQPIDPSRFQQMKWLGGWMTYARLLIPELVELSRVIYLDADLLVYADLHRLFEHDLEGNMIGAATWDSIRDSNDREFFKSLSKDTDIPYFNSGVILLDVDACRRSNLTERCLEIGDKYNTCLPSADQTILNFLLEGHFSQVPRRYNTPVTASRPLLSPTDCHDRIVHLVARPKPWDIFGFLNGQSPLFQQELAKTALCQSRPSLLSWKDWKLALRYSRAYAKCARARVFGG